MADILTQIAAYTRVRLDAAKQKISPELMKSNAMDKMKDTGFPFEKALIKKELSFICECKKASPSKGLIAEEYPYMEIGKQYEAAGADCISVLTEPHWFLGKNSHLQNLSSALQIPVLRKDFVVDEYMIYEAKVLGADAVLLICAITPPEELAAYIRLCDELGLSALVETHDTAEVTMAAKAGARIIGVNNRNLKNFTVDTDNSLTLAAQIPEDVLFVAESGIKTAEDVKLMAEAGADAVLVGETMMRAENKRKCLARLKSGLA